MMLSGKSYVLTSDDKSLATDVALKQHNSSGARGTRNAGSNYHYRYRGVLGEIAVARMLGIEPQVADFGGPVDRADIIMPDGTLYEVKCGIPVEGKDKLRLDAWYVVVKVENDVCVVTKVKFGEDILRDSVEPPEWLCPRPGTHKLNWLIT